MLDPLMHPKYSVEQRRLFYKNRIVLSRKSALIPTILHTYHDSVVGGHSGFLRTYKCLTGELFWKNMKKDVQDYVAKCQVCQTHKANSVTLAGLLQPLPIPGRVWDDISMDFVEGLPKSKGYDSIFVVVDKFSKYGHFIPLKHLFTAKEVVVAFIREVVKLHGFPQSIVSIRDKFFLSHFWNELFKLQGTRLKRSTSFHPQTDGQTEIVNKCIENYLRCFYTKQPKKWES